MLSGASIFACLTLAAVVGSKTDIGFLVQTNIDLRPHQRELGSRQGNSGHRAPCAEVGQVQECRRPAEQEGNCLLRYGLKFYGHFQSLALGGKPVVEGRYLCHGLSAVKGT